ncbi:thrombospondin type 3 repeat-containing protein [Epilithonimonas pallida]|uniref:IPT/TIG domain-containing protein n=1 Tax=Epilithonimonas pallida TaxID=373671 RepID=A0ABY1R1G9_9FLAO|nr:thrombospondin type 3 repeat-containing protein [Epilithonimonas pallida]SMP92148.1 hypothetical protein SAMN05421679_103486 [Epilithonimonas pallida]
MKKLNLLLIVVAFLLGNHLLFSQAVDRLYLSVSATGRVYDVTGVPATFPAPLATPNYSGSTPKRISNLAVGYDTPAGNPTGLVFIHSNTAAGSTIYKNTVSTGQSIPAAGPLIGGIGTNNVPKTDGNPSGVTYGFSNTTKNLYQIYPTYSNLGTVTGDAAWNGTGGNTSTIWATDTFFDYQNFIYVILQNTTNGTTFTRYLYRIDPVALTATRVTTITGPVGTYTATTTNSSSTTVGNVRGLAYLNGLVYAVSVNNDTQLNFYSINISTGASTFLRTYTGFTGLNATNQDLASVPYYIPFIFNCGGASIVETTPFVAGVSSTKTLRVPISTVYGPGTYRINISGTDFATSFTDVNVTSTTTYIDIPVTYNGTGSNGTRTLTYNINGSTTTCDFNAVIERDLDGDGIPDILDLDSDNDGILDIFECPESVVDVNYSVADGNTYTFNAPAADLGFIFDVYTLDNSFNLNINGVDLSTSKLEFQPDQTDNVRFVDGATYGNGTVPQIYNMTGNATNPLVRIIIHKNGSVSMYGSKTSGGQLYPLQLYNGNTFNTITWNRTGSNSIVLSQLVVGPTYITGRGNGVKNGFCDPDSDGISNQFDVDSDGDGCPDAIEGSEAVRYDQVHRLTLPNTDANYAYRGQIKTTYNGVTTGTPAQIISTSASSSGVPQLVNYANYNFNSTTNPSNLAGIVDNTDGTSDIGQGIGTSQNAAATDAECGRCFRPATTSGTTLPTNHGITALSRAGGNTSDWPTKVNGAYTALDAKTKGFVINRVPTSALSSITPVVGMLVYDTTANCLKMYDGTGWFCYTKQTCNDFNQ